MLVKILAAMAVVAVLFFLLKPDIAKTGPDDTRNWFVRAFDGIKGAWSKHGNTWKRWLCFIAGFATAIFTLWILGA